MASETAKAVAQDVIEARKKGGRIIMGKIVENRRYAKSTVTHPNRVTRTKSFQKEIKPFLQRLLKLRDKVTAEMEAKDIAQERFSELAGVLKGFNHDIQLLSGEATENIQYQPPIYGGLSRHNSGRKDIRPKEKDKSSERRNGGEQDC